MRKSFFLYTLMHLTKSCSRNSLLLVVVSLLGLRAVTVYYGRTAVFVRVPVPYRQ